CCKQQTAYEIETGLEFRRVLFRAHYPAFRGKTPYPQLSGDPAVKIPGYPGIRDPYSGRIQSEEHTSELQSRFDLVCRLLLEKKKFNNIIDLDHKSYRLRSSLNRMLMIE